MIWIQDLPNIRLIFRTIDSDEDYVEDIVKDIQMESEVLKEEDFEDDDNLLKRAEKCP